MDRMEQTTGRDGRGRFVAGHSGNPAGKKPGTRNRASLLKAALAEGEGEAAARIVIDKALRGDAVAARFLLTRLEPAPRGRAIALDLPEDLSSGEAVIAAFNAALKAMAAGEITPDEAVAVARFLEGRLAALKACERPRQLIEQTGSSPLGERMGEGESPQPRPSAAGRGATPSPGLSPRGEEKRAGRGAGRWLASVADSPAFRLHLPVPEAGRRAA